MLGVSEGMGHRSGLLLLVGDVIGLEQAAMTLVNETHIQEQPDLLGTIINPSIENTATGRNYNLMWRVLSFLNIPLTYTSTFNYILLALFGNQPSFFDGFERAAILLVNETHIRIQPASHVMLMNGSFWRCR